MLLYQNKNLEILKNLIKAKEKDKKQKRRDSKNNYQVKT